MAEFDRLNQRPEGLGWDPTTAAGEPSYRIVRIVVDECKVGECVCGGPAASPSSFPVLAQRLAPHAPPTTPHASPHTHAHTRPHTPTVLLRSPRPGPAPCPLSACPLDAVHLYSLCAQVTPLVPTHAQVFHTKAAPPHTPHPSYPTTRISAHTPAHAQVFRTPHASSHTRPYTPFPWLHRHTPNLTFERDCREAARVSPST